jgi:hypothetical protein
VTSTLTEFEDSSAFERTALAAVYPLLGTDVLRISDTILFLGM